MTGTGFTPPRLLRHADVQAALANSVWRRRLVLSEADNLLAATEDLIIECNDGVRLSAQHTPARQPNGRVAILLHGWEGSTFSLHVMSAADRLWRAGFRENDPSFAQSICNGCHKIYSLFRLSD